MSFWLYRTGLNWIDVNGHRAILSETWISEEPPVSEIQTYIFFQYAGQRLATPFGTGDVPHYLFATTRWFGEELHPQVRVITNLQDHNVANQPVLSSTAPEACFRLQRVGAATSGARPGRIAYPILEDRWFTDLPRRRHVDVDYLRPHLEANLDNWPNELNWPGRTFKNVIFHRKSFTWTLVDHYELQPSTCRLWQRWHTYPPKPGHTNDARWSPDEAHHLIR